jgi:DNA (cytosine-5)-methyltransferase 1
MSFLFCQALRNKCGYRPNGADLRLLPGLKPAVVVHMSEGSNFIDLFCGCGGFTLGMLRAGFKCKAVIDFNHQAIETLKANLMNRCPPGTSAVELALEKDLTEFPPSELAAQIGTSRLDVIVGGPPCQGFSTARQRDGSNHGSDRLKDDPRRHLFRNFLDYVEHFQPKVFVIENVLGLRSAAGGRYFTAVQHEARILGQRNGRPGYRVHGQIEKGEDLGVPQKRRRQLIIGVRADLPGYFPTELQPAIRAKPDTMLGDAIGDLPVLAAGEGVNYCAYDIKRRSVQFLNGRNDAVRRRYLYKVIEVQHAKALTNHVARPHSARDLRDFALLPEGTSSAELMRRGVEFEFPYDKTSFKDRYTRQHRNRTCSTIVAHLSKDGLMFIHPTQNRSLTPREAARVQSFPDWFVFPEARTHAFRVIGNAVPPLIGESVGDAVRQFLRSMSEPGGQKEAALRRFPSCIPTSTEQAASRLHILMHCDRMQLRALDAAAFINGWHALLWLFPGLHPDNALDHGAEKLDWPEAEAVLPGIEPSRRQVHVRSGWPVALVLIGGEAWRRYEAGEIADESFYCAEVQQAGLRAFRPSCPVTFA